MRGYHGSVECQLFPWEGFFVRIQFCSWVGCSLKGGSLRVGGSIHNFLIKLEICIELSMDSLAYAIYSW
jgi:hypothetical protein